ncbi:MAG: hypothetical protein ABFD75_12920 [Smithella sp.]
MMNCKKCNADLTDKEYRKVAEWNFCLDCFNELISRSEKAGNIQQATAVPDINFKNRKCVVCEKELGKNEGRDLLGSLLCEECYENLVKRPPENQAAGLEESRAEAGEKKGVAQVRVDFIAQTKCYQCGKTIRAIAAREHLGHLYCPDCYFNIPEIKNPPPQALVDAALQGEPKQDMIETEKAANGNICVCQACRRQVLKENIKIIEGFEICRACIAADPDMALEIARLRHRRRLEEIKKELTEE